MKKAILIMTIIAMSAVCANAAQVNLTWDANADPVAGYRIYQRTGADYGPTPAWDGTATSCTITVTDGVEVAFVARAYVVGGITGTVVESLNSNEVVPLMSRPHPPQNLVARILAAMRKFFRGLFS